MRVLHLFSNWKWTGPAEPALNLAAALRAPGHEVFFACGRPVKGCDNLVARAARDRGIEPVLRFRLNKHHHPIDNRHDLKRLPRFLERERIDLVHTHLDNDHRLAARAIHTAGLDIPIVRTYYGGDPPPHRSAVRRLLESASDAVIVLSDRVRDSLVAELGIPVGTVFRLEGTVDLARFDPRRGVSPIRERFEVPPGAPCFGVVARMQRHRRFDLLVETIARVRAVEPRVRFLFVGRGTRMEEVLVKPIRKRALSASVRFTGYLHGEDYVATLASLDALLFVVPGSDGSCRAVREAMAMGLPVIASQRGILPDLVIGGPSPAGYSLPEDPEAWARVILDLARDAELRARLSAAARARSARFALPAHAREVERIYRIVKRRRDPRKRAAAAVDSRRSSE